MTQSVSYPPHLLINNFRNIPKSKNELELRLKLIKKFLPEISIETINIFSHSLPLAEENIDSLTKFAFELQIITPFEIYVLQLGNEFQNSDLDETSYTELEEEKIYGTIMGAYGEVSRKVRARLALLEIAACLSCETKLFEKLIDFTSRYLTDDVVQNWIQLLQNDAKFNEETVVSNNAKNILIGLGKILAGSGNEKQSTHNYWRLWYYYKMCIDELTKLREQKNITLSSKMLSKWLKNNNLKFSYIDVLLSNSPTASAKEIICQNFNVSMDYFDRTILPLCNQNLEIYPQMASDKIILSILAKQKKSTVPWYTKEFSAAPACQYNNLRQLGEILPLGIPQPISFIFSKNQEKIKVEF